MKRHNRDLHDEYILFPYQVTGVLDQIKDLDEYTVFVPINAAIKQLNRTVVSDVQEFQISFEVCFLLI